MQSLAARSTAIIRAKPGQERTGKQEAAICAVCQGRKAHPRGAVARCSPVRR